MPNSGSAQIRPVNLLAGLAAVTTLGWVTTAAQPAVAVSLIPVDTELSLLIDVSLSISPSEYDLQLQGYQTAFTNLAPRFGGEEFGSVAVNVIQWAGAPLQEESVPWTLLSDEASVLSFAETLASLTRPFNNGTAPGSVIEFATPLFSSNHYDGQRWVIDVSGDGTRNSGIDPKTARDNALAAGVDAINGLPILSSTRSSLDDWYRENIQGGEGSFTIPAFGFEDVGRALEQKLIAELTLPPVDPPIRPEPPVVEPPASVPEPLTLWGLGAVLAGLLLYRRQRGHLA